MAAVVYDVEMKHCYVSVRRFTRFLLYLGYSAVDAAELKVQLFCRTVSSFAMEFRTAREKLIQQRQKAASQQARKGSRGFITVDVRLSALFDLGASRLALKYAVQAEVLCGCRTPRELWLELHKRERGITRKHSTSLNV